MAAPVACGWSLAAGHVRPTALRGRVLRLRRRCVPRASASSDQEPRDGRGGPEGARGGAAKQLTKRNVERVLVSSRLIVLLGVFPTLCASALEFLSGGRTVFLSASDLFLEPPESAEALSAAAVSAVDQFLLGTVLYIFAAGVYEIFVSPLTDDVLGSAASAPWIGESKTTLENLKLRLGQVIVVILLVRIVDGAKAVTIESTLDLVLLALAAALGSLALRLSIGDYVDSPDR